MMRPIGFEPLAKRFIRSVIVGLTTGMIAFTAVAFAGSWKNPGLLRSALVPAGLAFTLGFFCGFGLAFTRPELAPPQPNDDGDAEAGVRARLIPPVPTLGGKVAVDRKDA